jgi:hypothetical protein
MVSMSGHIILHAADAGDMALLRLTGWYLLGVSTIGTLAMTRSPSSALVLISCVVLWSAYRW